jgi:hypothetical protein
VIAPRRIVTYRDRDFAVYQRGEAWVVEVDGAEYFLTAGNDPVRQARRFLAQLPKNSLWPWVPFILATSHFPLILSIDNQIVRAWPANPPRDDPPKTYEHPQWAHRVVAVAKQPVWMFAARGLQTSAGGDANADQTIADVLELATAWLNASHH